MKKRVDDQTLMCSPRRDISESRTSAKPNTLSFRSYGGPSRFDLPEVDELTLGVFSSFDDITYNTQPIIQAPEKITHENKMYSSLFSGSSNSEQKHDASFSEIQDFKSENSDDDWQQSYFPNFETVPQLSKKFRFDRNNKENFKKEVHSRNGSQKSNEVADNHAKIIREVLKKYPHLVQHSKNIRLKIMQKETKNSECSTPVKTKISYVILKSDFLTTNNSERLHQKNLNCNSIVNDEIGPWKCVKCNLDRQYNSYFMYRRHMQDVHNEKFDPRICEHCGYKATKRNILMYHMYTKHNITPPKNMSFPKCKECSYVGLSESLLARHQASHKNSPLYIPQTTHSNTCMNEPLELEKDHKNWYDKKFTNLQESSDPSNGQDMNHKCSKCGKCFENLNNLQIHYKSVHLNSSDYGSSISATATSRVQSSKETDYRTNNKITEEEEEKFETARNPSSTQNFDYRSNFNCKEDGRMYNEESTHIQCKTSQTSSGYFIPNSNYVNTFEHLEYQDEIIAEVVEELDESMESDKNKPIYKLSPIPQIHSEETNIMTYIQNTSDRKAVDINKADNVMQYIEEETEILEYETNGNL